MEKAYIYEPGVSLSHSKNNQKKAPNGACIQIAQRGRT